MNNRIEDRGSRIEAVISCRGLRKSLSTGKEDVPVLKEVNLEVRRGERVAIVGASGSGKSTLLHLLGGLDNASGGSVQILGQDVQRMNEAQRGELRNRALGFVYQFHHLLPEFTALENVAMPLLIRGLKRTEAEPRAAAMPRALVTEPACVLADEPTGNLDRNSAQALFELMQQLNEKFDTSFIVVTHDTELAGRMQRRLHLVDGVLQEGVHS